jgi:hypothetical protein
MWIKSRGGCYRYLIVVGSLLLLCFMVTLIPRVISTSPSPYDPAYYGWSSALAGRRILAVLNTDFNPCALEHKRTIVIETMDTVTAAAPIDAAPTPSPFEIVLTLDPT